VQTCRESLCGCDSLPHTHTVIESRVYTTIFGVVVTHTHTLRYTLDTSETTCILSLFTHNINLNIYVLSRLCSVIAAMHVQKELLPCRPLWSPQVSLSPAHAECDDSHVD
jgi:hypothetical protein